MATGVTRDYVKSHPSYYNLVPKIPISRCPHVLMSEGIFLLILKLSSKLADGSDVPAWESEYM